jgi:hypothetical protein
VGEGPPVVKVWGGFGCASLPGEAADAEEVGGDPGGALHPADGGRQLWGGCAVFDELPPGVRSVVDRPVDEGVGEFDSEFEIGVVAGALPGVQDGIADPGGTAASAVVVPNPG